MGQTKEYGEDIPFPWSFLQLTVRIGGGRRSVPGQREDHSDCWAWSSPIPWHCTRHSRGYVPGSLRVSPSGVPGLCCIPYLSTIPCEASWGCRIETRCLQRRMHMHRFSVDSGEGWCYRDGETLSYQALGPVSSIPGASCQVERSVLWVKVWDVSSSSSPFSSFCSPRPPHIWSYLLSAFISVITWEHWSPLRRVSHNSCQ